MLVYESPRRQGSSLSNTQSYKLQRVIFPEDYDYFIMGCFEEKLV